MARRSIQDNIRMGLLSVNNAAALSGFSATQIRTWIVQGQLMVFKVPQTKNEFRISAASLLELIQDLRKAGGRWPISKELEQAAANYTQRHQKS